MIRHIEFCLEEIECEIEAQSDTDTGLSELGRLSLQRHIAQMRAVLADWQATAATTAPIAADIDHAGGDKLDLIRGIDTDTARLLVAKGVTSFQIIADWRHDDITSLGDAKLSLARIAGENWIEQAAILATGQLTLHAKQIELARIAHVDIVTAAIADPAATIETFPETVIAIAEIAPVVAAEPAVIAAQPVTIAAATEQPKSEIAAKPVETAPEANVVDLATVKRTGIGRRMAQVAAALTIIAAGIGAFNGWDLASVTAITAALAEQTQIR